MNNHGKVCTCGHNYVDHLVDGEMDTGTPCVIEACKCIGFRRLTTGDESARPELADLHIKVIVPPVPKGEDPPMECPLCGAGRKHGRKEVYDWCFYECGSYYTARGCDDEKEWFACGQSYCTNPRLEVLLAIVKARVTQAKDIEMGEALPKGTFVDQHA